MRNQSCRCLDLNPGLLVSTLSTVPPQPLNYTFVKLVQVAVSDVWIFLHEYPLIDVAAISEKMNVQIVSITVSLMNDLHEYWTGWHKHVRHIRLLVLVLKNAVRKFIQNEISRDNFDATFVTASVEYFFICLDTTFVTTSVVYSCICFETTSVLNKYV